MEDVVKHAKLRNDRSAFTRGSESRVKDTADGAEIAKAKRFLRNRHRFTMGAFRILPHSQAGAGNDSGNSITIFATTPLQNTLHPDSPKSKCKKIARHWRIHEYIFAKSMRNSSQPICPPLSPFHWQRKLSEQDILAAWHNPKNSDAMLIQINGNQVIVDSA
ncbi:hypothetical protein EO087_02925 [Dyella sp. M7H15-1]|uniref:hypothetical protein n=1 Tax=Dyella sp. M7H15-1 TaxID=2501295 RepID=UPI001005124F|nr:hypothetical protein [Dyella sp. M7H15-1]QAU23070.1 hypothetical protein EO087_02925 [Dyella sp. M7H15-1]